MNGWAPVTISSGVPRGVSSPLNLVWDGADGVGQIVEIDGLTISINMRCDDTKAVKGRPLLLVWVVQVKPDWLPIEGDNYLPTALPGRGIVLERPVV